MSTLLASILPSTSKATPKATTEATTSPEQVAEVKATTARKDSALVALPAEQKQSHGGKFITATTSQQWEVEQQGAKSSRQLSIEARKFKLKATKAYSSAPKNLKSITCSIAFCRHTNTRISHATGFSQCKALTTLLPVEHPIFSQAVPLQVAMEIYGQSRTPTEKYLAMTCVLVKSGVIDTSKCGLCLDTKDVSKLEPVFQELLAVLHQAMRIDGKFTIDALLVDDTTQDDVSRLKTHIKETAYQLDSKVFDAGGDKLLTARASETTKSIKMDWEIEMERELNKIMHAPSSTVKYDKSMAKWVREALARNGTSKEDITHCMTALHSSPDNLTVDYMKQAQKLLETNLDYETDVTRRNSNLALKCVSGKIELQVACLFKHGFIADIEEETITSDNKDVVEFRAKTGIKESEAIAKISKATSPALQALRAKLRRN